MGVSWSNSSRNELKDAENELLEFGIKWFGDNRVRFKSYDVPTTNENVIHTLEFATSASADASDVVVEEKGDESKEDDDPIVLMHGYGGGGAYYYAVLPQLATRWKGGRVFAVDSAGCGLSSRPPWSDPTDRVKTENYMVSELEAWRSRMGIKRMTLCGHSVGGYIAVAYAEKHPERVRRLVLASPVGVPRQPPTWESDMKERMGWKASVFLSLWSRGWSPFTPVRWFGSYGESLVSKYVDRRFEPNSPWISPTLLKSYIYNNFIGQPSCGNYAHAALLKPGAWAKAPLCDRIPSLKGVTEIVFLYGSHDWMGSNHAVTLQNDMAASSSDISIDVRIVNNAGHNLQVDNPKKFVAELFDALRS